MKKSNPQMLIIAGVVITTFSLLLLLLYFLNQREPADALQEDAQPESLSALPKAS